MTTSGPVGKPLGKDPSGLRIGTPALTTRGLVEDDLREVAKVIVAALGEDFEGDQDAYRAGFEAALQPDLRWKSAVQAMDLLAERFPDTWNSGPFRRGFERGQAYWSRKHPENTAAGSATGRSSTMNE